MKIDFGSGAYMESDDGARDSIFHKRIVQLERIPNTRAGYMAGLECGHRAMIFGDPARAEGVILCSQCRDLKGLTITECQ